MHLEFRAADATANPHLALACLLLAGLEGVRQGLVAATALEGDPEPWPTSLTESLDLAETSALFKEGLPGLLRDTYFAVKRSENDQAMSLDESERLAAYRRIY